MRVLYFDCGMGAAGDMLSASLYELLDENDRKQFVSIMNSLGIEGLRVEVEATTKCGIKGTHMRVTYEGHDEEHHQKHHEHHHEHHHHSSMSDIRHIISHLNVSPKIQNDVINIYELIAQAESSVHGVPVTDIHFHEVGAMDAVADITSVCILIDMLRPDKIYSSSIHVGSGYVECAHGILPVPAPATTLLLKDIPVYSTDIQGELCTPTGAALLKYFTDDFCPMPQMRLIGSGYGMGFKDFKRANCVRALIGEAEGEDDKILELSCNLDDMTGEEIGYASELLLSEGALDVFTIPVGMKKSRPGIMLNVLCKENQKDKFIRLIFKHTSTLGIRFSKLERSVLERETITEETKYGPISLKSASGYGVSKKKYEYEDLVRISRENGLSISEVKKDLT